MKPIDGLELLRRVRSHKLTRDIPFLVVTADGSDENCRLALEAGADDFLPKPFSLAAFREAVAHVARGRHGARTRAEAHAGEQLGDEALDALGDARAARPLGVDDRDDLRDRRAADRR